MRRTLMVGFLLMLAAGSAAGQGRPQTREGFWIGFGLGGASYTCDGCDDTYSGGTAYLALGGTVSPSLLLGAESNAYSYSDGSLSFVQTMLAAVATFYPTPSGGFHLKGGLGIAAETVEFGGFSASENAVGVLLGLGYDGRVGRNFALRPYLNVTRASLASGASTMLQLGLGFHWF